MLPNVTVASAILLSAFDYSASRDGVVMTDGEFPSVRYVYDSLATRLVARIRVVPSPAGDGLTAADRIAAAIDE